MHPLVAVIFGGLLVATGLWRIARRRIAGLFGRAAGRADVELGILTLGI
jgi:hypothetical protein